MRKRTIVNFPEATEKQMGERFFKFSFERKKGKNKYYK